MLRSYIVTLNINNPVFKGHKSEEAEHLDLTSTSTFYHVLLYLRTHACMHVARMSEKKWAARQTCAWLHTHTYVRRTYTCMRTFTCISIPLTGISSIACLGMNEPLRHALVLTGPLPQPSSSFSSSSSSSSSTSSFSRNPLVSSPRSRLSLF